MIISTNIEHLRDPFILVDNGVYYAYGTWNTENGWEDTVWGCFKNTSGKLDGEWNIIGNSLYVRPEHAQKNLWAPEVHKYNGSYYMFATYYSSLTNHRGCSVLKSSSPEGPFTEITNGHITPRAWDAIDGTFYVDKNGQPWMIFVHEWTCTKDNIGTMAAAKLSGDLTHFISEPVELFRADSPAWTDKCVTDGCFMYDTNDGGLLMLWSNFDFNKEYCVGIAHSSSGFPDGNWTQEPSPFFSKKTTGKYDGGHGMIFKDTDQKQYLCVHSPNVPENGHSERTIFVPVKEENGTLICDVF